ELFPRARVAYDSGDRATARTHLEKLLADWRDQLRVEALRDSARMLLFCAIDAKDAGSIVRSFEMLKEKDPEFTLGFEPVLSVAAAYRKLEEHERALLLLQATLDETFGKDLKVAGLLSDQGRCKPSFELLERLWREYPDAPPMLQAYLALSDNLLTRAPKAHEDARLRAE